MRCIEGYNADMSTGYGVVVIPLINAPADLSIHGQGFTPGILEARHVGEVRNVIEILQETIPSPLTFIFDKANRSHIVFTNSKPLGSHYIFALERIQSRDQFNLDVLVLHVHLKSTKTSLLSKLSELRTEGLNIIEKSLQLESKFIAPKRRAFCAVHGVGISKGKYFQVFSKSGLIIDRDVRTWGCETVILGALQHFAVQKVYESLPSDVREFSSLRVLRILKLFVDKYWIRDLLIKKSAQKLLETLRYDYGTVGLAQNVIDLYLRNLEYAQELRGYRLNLALFVIGVVALVATFFSMN